MEILILYQLCQERWRRDRLGVAEISEWSKYMENIPHSEKLSICHIDKNLCTGSGCTVPCEISKWYKYVETKIFVLKLTYRAYETMK